MHIILTFRIQQVAETGPIAPSGKGNGLCKHIVIVLHRRMAAITLLREVFVFAIGLLLLAQPAGISPSACSGVFGRIFQHELGMHEITGNRGGLPMLMNRVLEYDLGQHGPFRPWVGVA